MNEQTQPEVRRAAQVARISHASNARYQAEGICAVCGLVVPVRITAKMWTADHWPDDPRHSYDSDPRCYCIGGNMEPASLFDRELIARVSVSPETMALLMDGAADELEGRVAIVAIAFADELPRAEVHRLSRAWSEKIAEKPVVAETRVRVYGNGHLEAVA